MTIRLYSYSSALITFVRVIERDGWTLNALMDVYSTDYSLSLSYPWYTCKMPAENVATGFRLLPEQTVANGEASQQTDPRFLRFSLLVVCCPVGACGEVISRLVHLLLSPESRVPTVTSSS